MFCKYTKDGQGKRGFALVEIIIASAIISISVFALLSVSRKTIELSRGSLERVQASYVLEEGAEVVKLIRDSDWSVVSGFIDGTVYYPTFISGVWSLSTTPITTNGFTRTVVFSEVYRDNADSIGESGTLDSGTRKVTVFVSWDTMSGPVSKSLSFYITDIFS